MIAVKALLETQPRRTGRWIPAAAGLVAVGVAIAVAELLSALGRWFTWFGEPSSPLTSLANGFIELTPGWLKNWAVGVFGVHDKTALAIGMGVVLLALAATLGWFWSRSRALGGAVLAVLCVIVMAAVLTRTGVRPTDLIPTLLGAALGLLVLRGTTAGRGSTDPEDRRRVLTTIGWSAAAAVVTGLLTRLVPDTARVEASREAVTVPEIPDTVTGSVTAPAPAVTEPQIPAGADLHIDGLASYLTPATDFYRIDTAFLPPQLRAEDWSLHVHGMVAKEITINFAELQARQLEQHMVTLTCVSNEVGGDLIGNASWTGARLDALLAEAGPAEGADCVLSTSVDGFTCTTPLAVLTDGRDALLAFGMNGEPLPVEHGFPVRMVVPGLYGYVSATKWVTDLQVTRFADVTAYWTERGWAPQGPIKTASRIDVPRSPAQFSEGEQVTIAGVAWAQHRGIESVQVQINDGPWLRTDLGAVASVDTWRQWRMTWTATGVGNHRVRCRAVDGTGTVQTSVVADPAPNGASGYHAINIQITG